MIAVRRSWLGANPAVVAVRRQGYCGSRPIVPLFACKRGRRISAAPNRRRASSRSTSFFRLSPCSLRSRSHSTHSIWASWPVGSVMRISVNSRSAPAPLFSMKFGQRCRQRSPGILIGSIANFENPVAISCPSMSRSLKSATRRLPSSAARSSLRALSPAGVESLAASRRV
jgi:hypothetical protein